MSDKSSKAWATILSTDGVVSRESGIRGPLSRLLNEGATSSSTARGLANGRLSGWRGFRAIGGDFDDITSRLGRRGVTATGWSVGGKISGVWNAPAKFGGYWSVGGLVTGGIADLIVGGVWQGISDAREYKLWAVNRDLALRRVYAGAEANFINGVIGGGIGAVVAAGLGWSPIGWGAIGLGIGATVLWDVTPWGGQEVSQWVFDFHDANISRGLSPLQLP